VLGEASGEISFIDGFGLEIALAVEAQSGRVRP
jgi:hypothetical protein